MRRISAGLVLLVLVTGFAAGWGISSLWSYVNNGKNVQKPIITASQDTDKVNDDTQIVFEQEYLRCRHVIISEFAQRDQLMGKALSELRQAFNSANGYQINMQGQTLVIRQKINDWCPQDKEKYRLKEYQGKVAIYQGPDSDNDILLRVTNLPLEMLPAEIQEKIRAGSYEFTSEQALNDALENFDEYL